MPPISSAVLADVRLDPAPIRPEWIRQGAPVARCAELSRSADGMALAAVWDCTAGAFDWHFAGDEWVHVLEGEVTVEDAAGRRTLRAGDVALFPAGSTSRWTVETYVKKLAFCREPAPRLVLMVAMALRRLKALLRGAAPAAANPLAA